jgi:riboflavin kinase/FMN adenylyltransferase
VHIAHREIISHTVEYAKKYALSPIALTFDVSPHSILSSGSFGYINTNDQKEELISSLGAKTQFLVADEKLLSMSPEDFVKEILVEEFRIKHAVCGYNYRFGRGGKGDTQTLCSLGEKYGFSVEVCNRVTAYGKSVSSSRIRELLLSGSMEEANLLLGRCFFIEGTVREGKHLGRTLGFPTANVFFESNIIPPKAGVYKTIAIVGQKQFDAITNVGENPTVGGEAFRTETYIPHFSQDLYGKTLRIEFISFIRPERKFESLEELKKQIEKDIEI